MFFDVVGYTTGRSVEAQSDIVHALNAIVLEVLDANGIPDDQRILIPTGDGVCIALIDIKQPFDIHVELAVQLIDSIQARNEKTDDPMRQFKVRVGLNENVDNVVIDVNGRKNVAGQGINMAQRIMDNGDAGQVLVGSSVHEILSGRERYMKAFRKFSATTKHGQGYPVFQLTDSKRSESLDTSTPSVFRQMEEEPVTLNDFQARYLAIAAANRDFIVGKNEQAGAEYTTTVLLYFEAYDSTEETRSTYKKPTLRTWGSKSKSFGEKWGHYEAIDFWVRAQFSHYIISVLMGNLQEFFDSPSYIEARSIVNGVGTDLLREEFPDLWEEFGLDALYAD